MWLVCAVTEQQLVPGLSMLILNCFLKNKDYLQGLFGEKFHHYWFEECCRQTLTEREQKVLLTSTFLRGGISTTAFKFVEVWKNYSDEIPTQIYLTELWVRDDQPFLPSRRKGSEHQPTLSNRLHMAPESSTCLKQCSGYCSIAGSCLHVLLIQVTSSAPNHKKTLSCQQSSIPDFWPSIINVLKKCVHH